MPERDANQLAADVRAGIGVVSLDLSAETPALAALDELVGLVGTLQQERDEQTEVTESVTRSCFDWKRRAVAAEAALAEAQQQIKDQDRRIRCQRTALAGLNRMTEGDSHYAGRKRAEAALAEADRVGTSAWAEKVLREREEAVTALATTRQALAEIERAANRAIEKKSRLADLTEILYIVRTTLAADTGGDTKEPA